jgi:hypothetical protein
MSLQDEMNRGAQEYARHLEKQRETDRLAALVAEARHHGNASAFAQAFEEALAGRINTEHDDDTETQENHS